MQLGVTSIAEGGDRHSLEAVVAAHECERNVVQLYIRGLTGVGIAQQLRLELRARGHLNRAIRCIPPGDAKAGARPNSPDEMKTMIVRHDVDEGNGLIDWAFCD